MRGERCDSSKMDACREGIAPDPKLLPVRCFHKKMTARRDVARGGVYWRNVFRERHCMTRNTRKKSRQRTWGRACFSSNEGIDVINPASSSYEDAVSDSQDWNFFSNFGHVLVALARDPEARIRDLADAVGITERAVQRLLHEMEAAGFIEKHREGRRNRYVIGQDRHLRHQLERHCTLGELLDLLVPESGAGSAEGSGTRNQGPERENRGA